MSCLKVVSLNPLILLHVIIISNYIEYQKMIIYLFGTLGLMSSNSSSIKILNYAYLADDSILKVEE